MFHNFQKCHRSKISLKKILFRNYRNHQQNKVIKKVFVIKINRIQITVITRIRIRKNRRTESCDYKLMKVINLVAGRRTLNDCLSFELFKYKLEHIKIKWSNYAALNIFSEYFIT